MADDSRINRTTTSSFVIDYPRQAALAALEKRHRISALISRLNWQIDVGAGYNVLPDGYALFDNSQVDVLSGSEEWLWLELREAMIFQAKEFKKTVGRSILDILRTISLEVHRALFLDLQTRQALLYDPLHEDKMRGGFPYSDEIMLKVDIISRYARAKYKMHAKHAKHSNYVPDLTDTPPVIDTQQPFQGAPKTWMLPGQQYSTRRWQASDIPPESRFGSYSATFTGYSHRPYQSMDTPPSPIAVDRSHLVSAVAPPLALRPASGVHSVRMGQPGRRTSRSRSSVESHGVPAPPAALPFWASARFTGQGPPIRLSVMAIIRIEASHHHIPHLQSNFEVVSDQTIWKRCNIILEKTEMRQDEPFDSTASPLQLSETRIEFGPSGPPTTRIFAHNQTPQLTQIAVSTHTTSSNRSITIGGGYNQTIASYSATSGSSVAHPAASIALDIPGVKVGISNENVFYWKYPISKSQSQFGRLAQFSDHSGTVMYDPASTPDSMRVKTSMISTIRRPNMNMFQRLVSFPTRVKDSGRALPCRQIKFCLQIDVQPDEEGYFDYPRPEDRPNLCLDTGTYRFSQDNEGLLLEIQRQEDVPAVVINTYDLGPSAILPMGAQLLNQTLVVTERSVGPSQPVSEAKLEIDLPRKRRKSAAREAQVKRPPRA